MNSDIRPLKPVTKLFNRLPILVLLTLGTALLAGCESRNPVFEVRPDQARTTLIAALDGWKVGRTIEEMQAEKPSIVVQDVDWMGGQLLEDYELLGDGKPMGANLSIEVRLKLKDPAGKVTEKNVWYLVGTDPVLTVFRDMFR